MVVGIDVVWNKESKKPDKRLAEKISYRYIGIFWVPFTVKILMCWQVEGKQRNCRSRGILAEYPHVHAAILHLNARC
jgi:hypothetical protein